MPKVSIIIPVYNAEKYLRDCLDSVANQTLKDIEIICVDDGSPDSCPQILDEYAANDNRFKIIHQKNAGVAAARNAAYPFIKGEYTLFVDSDDIIELDLCEKTVA
ncbi:MAG: glycosyltransferase, partial [Planctomycetaceae bacterium]|nr:glycosyltransferase [Planctomycetaceae bacterium]